MAPTQAATRGWAPWPKDALRISFGVIWLIDPYSSGCPGSARTT